MNSFKTFLLILSKNCTFFLIKAPKTSLNTLRKLTDDLSMSIFVINHAPMPTEIFDYKIEISKKNNFSDIAFDKMV